MTPTVIQETSFVICRFLSGLYFFVCHSGHLAENILQVSSVAYCVLLICKFSEPGTNIAVLIFVLVRVPSLGNIYGTCFCRLAFEILTGCLLM